MSLEKYVGVFPHCFDPKSWLKTKMHFFFWSETLCSDYYVLWKYIPKHPRVPSPQVITIPLSLAKTENPSPAPTFVIDLVFSDSTASGLDLQVSSSPWPSCPRRPSPQVKTSNSDVRATIWLVLTATYRYKFRFYALIYCRNWNKKEPKWFTTYFIFRS